MLLAAALALSSSAALALSRDAEEFIAISKELEPRLQRSSDPQDLEAISRASREAFYRCE
jgi:hypothetical protein